MSIKNLIISSFFTLIVLIAGCNQGRIQFSLKEEPIYGMGIRATVYVHYDSEKRVIYDTIEEPCGGGIHITGPIASPDEKYVLFSFISGEGAHLALFDCTNQKDIYVSIERKIIDPAPALGARQPMWFPDSKRFLFFAQNPSNEGGPWIYSVDTGEYEVCEKLKGHNPDIYPEPHWDIPGESVTMYGSEAVTLPVE